MEEIQDADSDVVIPDLNNISINDPVAENDPGPTGSEQVNACESLFDLLKENNKHIFVLSTAGKPIYTRYTYNIINKQKQK